jgi:YihY family inner membrane protein
VRRVGGWLKQFWVKAYEANVTGMSAMVAYNLLLSVLPLALVALFVAGQLLQSGHLQASILEDLRRLFPSAADSTLTSALHRVQTSTTSVGVAALVSALWIGSSFWGALDTAFCEIYHGTCRSWLEQKRFALGMVVVVLLFMAATISVPTLQGVAVSGAESLPFGLGNIHGIVVAVSLAGGLAVLFSMLCLIYWRVPKPHMEWRAVWPGALGAALAIGIVDYAFPFYLSHVTTIARLGTTLVFILIVLLWCYLLAIIILGGATINALRHEHHLPHPAVDE